MRTNHNASGKPSLEGCVGLRYPLRWVLQATYPWVCGILTRFFPFFFCFYTYSMPNSAGSKKAAALSRGTHVERKEFRRRIRLTYRKELSFSLTYIVYQIFWLVQIFIGFFCRRRNSVVLPAILPCRLNFCRQQKNRPQQMQPVVSASPALSRQIPVQSCQQFRVYPHQSQTPRYRA